MTDYQTQLATEATQVQDTLAQIQAMPVQDQQTISEITVWAQQAAKRAKEIEALRVSITKPQNDAIRATNAIFKPVIDRYEQLKRLLGQKVVEGHQYLEAKQREALALAASQYQAGQTAQANQSLALMPAEPEHKGVSIRQVTRWEITDATLLPREYLAPDERKINAAASSGIAVPGVRVWQESTGVVRAK